MTDYFPIEETQCKCGCGQNWTPQFHAKMNLIRAEVGTPMVVSSGCRCEAYDKSIGGKGAHATGNAGDFLCSGSHAHAILKAALKAGVSGIGISQRGAHGSRFIHLDITEGPMRPWVWSY